MVNWPRGVARLCYGGDYNPEQWPEEVWAQDVALMRTAGVNLVSVGVFAWSSLEPVEGTYDFGWLDRVLDLLDGGGIKVNLATPTASPPPWFGIAYPDALPQTASGNRLWHGSRDTYCVSAPAYRDASVRIARVLGERYAGHPALAMWHVHNEYGTGCFCDHAAEAFRGWLRARHGDLDRLNEAWTTAFWSQRYTDWSQILPPRATQYLSNPSQVLDFRRFLSDEHLSHFRAQREVLRELTPDVPITTNLALGSWVPVNPRDWAAETDLVAIDHYPSSLASAAPESAFTADLARSWAGGGPWLLMEQAVGAVTERGRIAVKPPGAMARHTLAHVARGSRGAMCFQWRQSRGGAELYHSGMVPHAGPDSRVFREATELGAVLGRLGDVDTGRIEADAAVLWDTECWWALQTDHLPSRTIDYLAEVHAAHRALWSAGVPVDFAHPSDDLSRYRLIVAPALYLLSDAAAAALTAYVHGGGNLVVSYLSGIADPDHRVHLGGYPGALRELLGIRVEEFHPLTPDESVPLTGPGDAAGDRSTEGRTWSEYLHADEAVEVLLRYAGDGQLSGRPAATLRRYGSGTARYLSTRLTDDAYRDLLISSLGGTACRPGADDLDATEGVEVVRRSGDGTSWVFVLNHTGVEQRVSARGRDLVSGAVVAGEIRMAPGGFAVLREE